MQRTILIVLVALLGLLMVGCSEEKPAPAPEKPVAATPETPPPAAAEVKQTVEAVQQKVEETSTAVKQEVKSEVEAVEQKAAAAVEQEKTGLTDMVTKAQPAAKPAVTGPATVLYDASKGVVTFDHAGHAGRHACSSCHNSDPPQKIAIDKATAHDLCKGCHKQSGGNAPTACSGCHKS